jgi:hypothetical protein
MNEKGAILFDGRYDTVILMLNKKTIKYSGFSFFHTGGLKEWIGLECLFHPLHGTSGAQIGF